MRLLLDTHTFVWWGQGKLPKRVVNRIEQAEIIYVSVVTGWEIAIKQSLARLIGNKGTAMLIEQYGFSPLSISSEHADAVRDLPQHHGDPFDRMLVAQAIVEELVLVTKDDRLKAYDIAVIWD
jgi:PIN domain nuclease of toxin-antitoxin system